MSEPTDLSFLFFLDNVDSCEWVHKERDILWFISVIDLFRACILIIWLWTILLWFRLQSLVYIIFLGQIKIFPISLDILQEVFTNLYSIIAISTVLINFYGCLFVINPSREPR